MKSWLAAAPCQCRSPGGAQIEAPGPSSTTSPPACRPLAEAGDRAEDLAARVGVPDGASAVFQLNRHRGQLRRLARDVEQVQPGVTHIRARTPACLPLRLGRRRHPHWSRSRYCPTPLPNDQSANWFSWMVTSTLGGLGVRVLAGEFRDLSVQRLLLLAGPAREHGDVDQHDAVVAVHAEVIRGVAERTSGPVVAWSAPGTGHTVAGWTIGPAPSRVVLEPSRPSISGDSSRTSA